MWSDERETPATGLAGSGWVDRGEDLVWGIFRESDRLGDDGEVEADQNTWRPRWCRARVVAVSRAPGTTRREAQRSGIQPRTYALCHQPPLPTNYLQQRDLSSHKPPLQPHQTARTHKPRKDGPGCEKSIFVPCSDLSRLCPLISQPADPPRRDREQRSHTGSTPACSEVPNCDRNAHGGVALHFGRHRVNSTYETALNTLEGRPPSVVGTRTVMRMRNRFIRGRDAFQMANTDTSK